MSKKTPRIQYTYYYDNKKYDRKALAELVGSDAFYKHIKDFEHNNSRYSNIQKTSYGYDYRFINGDFAGETIQIHIKKITHKKINVDTFFYALDIETSTFYNNKDENWHYEIKNGERRIVRDDNDEISIPYLIGVRTYNLNKMLKSPISDGYIAKYFKDDYFKGFDALRTYNDLNHYLKHLILEAYAKKTVKFLIIQNNSYEHSFLHANVYTQIGTSEGFKYECSYINSHKPMKIDFFYNNDLCLRILDSYLLTGKSIKSYGKTYGYDKLDKSDDYNSTYTSADELPQDELIYNKRDLDISALMFKNVINDLEITSGKRPQEILPCLYTKTGITRLKNRWLFENRLDNIYYNQHDMKKDNLNAEVETFINCDGDILKKKLYKFNHDCFIGGFVRANEKTVYEIQNKVKSIDITSSYPYSMVKNLYGYEYKQVDEDFDKLAFLIEWKTKADVFASDYRKLQYNYFKNFLFHRLSKTMPFFNCSVILNNVNPKELQNNNSMLIMSTSKVIDSEGAFVNNGRIVTAKKVAINVSNVELFNYLLIYDFEIDSCAYLEYANKVERLSKSVRSCIENYYKRKSDFKKLVFANKNNTLVKTMKSIENLSLNEFEQNYVVEHQQDTDIDIWLNQNLMNAKADLNAQYGINVERPNHNEIICSDDNIYTEIENDVEQSIIRRNFKVGMLITGYSRLHLIMMSLNLMRLGATVHYWDTDSIKFTCADEDEPDIDYHINLFNKMVGKFENCEEIGTYTKEYQPNKKYSYDSFVSCGSKNYWVLENDEIEFTVSGLTSNAHQLVNSYFNNQCNCDFYKFVSEALQPMTTFDGEAIGTTLVDYQASTLMQMVELPDGTEFEGYSGVIINQPQSRAMLPHPSVFIENRFYKIYNKRIKPQLLTFDGDTAVMLEVKDTQAYEIFNLR